MTDDRMTDRGKRWATELDEDDESSKSGESDDRSDSSDSSDNWVSADSVKSEYPARQFYLNPELVDRLDDEYKRLQYVADFDFGKDRHFYPAVVLAGLEALEDMEGEEFQELLERLE